MVDRSCPSCGADLEEGDQTCQECGQPLSYGADEEDVPCRVCGAEIEVLTETCPECGETGYPALRPRRGGGFKGSPAFEGDED